MAIETESYHPIYCSPVEAFDEIKGPLLVAVGQPKPYALLEQSEIEARRIALNNPYAATWESQTYPVRGALALGTRRDTVVMLPDTEGVSQFLRGFENIRQHYNLGKPIEHIDIPWDMHEPPDTLDAAILRIAPDVANNLHTLRPNDQRYTVITHATTPDTRAWMDELQKNGIDTDSFFQPKVGERPSYAYRDGFSSYRLGQNPEDTFTSRNNIPAAPGIIAYSADEAKQAYEIISSVSGNSSVFTKIDESGGGSYLGQDDSSEAVVKRFDDWKNHGKLDSIYQQPTPIEIQAAIPGIVSTGSFQYVGEKIVTPGPGYTMQIMDNNLWQGNVYNNSNIDNVPEDEQEGVEGLIYEFQSRFMKGVHLEGGSPVGGCDFVIAQISKIPHPEVFIPEDMLEMAKDLGVDYMPIAVEHNGLRASDALWPALFAEQLGVLDEGLQFMTIFVSPVRSDLDAAWNCILEMGSEYSADKNGGIVPLAWVNDHNHAIHSGTLLVVGRDIEDMRERLRTVKTRLKSEGLIDEKDGIDF